MTINTSKVIENPTEAGSQELASTFRAAWREMKGQLGNSGSSFSTEKLDSLVSEIAFRVEHSEPSNNPSNKSGTQYGPRLEAASRS